MQPVAPPPGYPREGSYADLLLWHLYVWRTRPGGSTTERGEQIWSERAFKDKVFKNEGSADSARKNYLYWTGYERCSAPGPKYASLIAEALFDAEPQFATWADDLERARGRSMGAGKNIRHIDIGVALAELDRPLPNADSVPRPTDYFVGRDEDVDALARAIMTGSRAVLVEGGPGVGKTELTKAVAHDFRVTARFGRRTWFVELEAATSAEAMKNAITRTLGCDPQHGFQATLDTLRDKPALVILDNLETPWEPVAEREATQAVLAGLVAVPGVALLASMRGQEWMKQPTWLTHPLPVLSHDDAAALFAAIAGPWVHQDPALNDFLTALGGLPLAIELVARRAHGRTSLAPLWAEWGRIGTELARHPDFTEARLTSLPHSIELSLLSHRATAPALRLLSLLGCLPGGLATQDLATLMSDDAYAAEERLLALGLAVERSGRITLLPPIRDHASRRCLPSAETRRQWVAHFLTLTEACGATREKVEAGGSLRFRDEIGNVEAAFRASLSSGEVSSLRHAVECLGHLTYVSALSTNVFEELELGFRNIGDVSSQAICIKCDGDIALRRSDYEKASLAYRRAIDLLDPETDAHHRAECLRHIGDIELSVPNFDTAAVMFNEAARIFQRIDDRRGQANCIKSVGDIFLRKLDFPSAQRQYELALDIFVEIRSVVGEANCLERLADVAIESDTDRAANMFTRALALHRKTGNALGIANCTLGLGQLYISNLDYDSGEEYATSAMSSYMSVGDVLGEANCLDLLGDIASKRSNFSESSEKYERALFLYRAIGDRQSEANCLCNIASTLDSKINKDKRQKYYSAALFIYQQIGDSVGADRCREAISA